MSKKIIALFAAVLMLAMCLTACVGGEDTSTPDDPTATTTTTGASDETTVPGEDATTTVGGDETTAGGDETTEPDEPGVTEPVVPGTTTSGRRPSTTVPPQITVTTQSYTTVPEESRTLAKDVVKDMGGYAFTFTSSWLPNRNTSDPITLFEQQLFDRADEVEEDYNCSIKFDSFWMGADTLRTYIQAGKNKADIMEGMVGSQFYPSVGAGYLMSWTKYTEDSKVINTSDARWIDSYTELGRYPLDGQIYGMQFMRPAEVRFCVVFNKTLIKNAGKDPDALYTAVKNNTWNYNMLREYCLAVTKDTNSDGTNDTWGMTGDYNYMTYSFVWSNGGRVVDVIDGKVTCTMADNKVINGITFLDGLVNTDKVVYFPEAAKSEETWGAAWDGFDSIGSFINGNIAFLFHESWTINQQISPRAKFDYGMLPLPMGPDAKSYVTPSDNARLCCMAITNKNADKSVVIFNALARPLNDVVDYSDDLAAEYFQKGDTESLKMYYFCLENAMGDLGSGVTALTTALTHAIARSMMWGQTTPAAAIAALDGTYNGEINAIYAPKK